MSKELTEYELKLYAFIAECIRKNGYPPSITEMMEGTGSTSRGWVAEKLRRLESAGYIRRFGETPRQAIELTGSGMPYNGEAELLCIYGTDGHVIDRVPAPASGKSLLMLKVTRGVLRGRIIYKGAEIDEGDLLLIECPAVPPGILAVRSGSGFMQVTESVTGTDEIIGRVTGLFRQ